MRYTDPAAKTILEYGGLRLISRAFTGDTAAMEFLQTVFFDTAPGYTRSDSGDTPSTTVTPSGGNPHGNPETHSRR